MSQNRMKRVALSEASLSIDPDRNIGWLAITPTGRPSTRANPVMIACPPCAATSRKSPSSKMRSRISCMS
ncbi:Uncharacterised protein [Mycobacterium tuberculosis]|nr:Uncharacterised protein [Mycobacterium tuberculosis]